jgi:hypothetical protein
MEITKINDFSINQFEMDHIEIITKISNIANAIESDFSAIDFNNKNLKKYFTRYLIANNSKNIEGTISKTITSYTCDFSYYKQVIQYITEIFFNNTNIDIDDIITNIRLICNLNYEEEEKEKKNKDKVADVGEDDGEDEDEDEDDEEEDKDEDDEDEDNKDNEDNDEDSKKEVSEGGVSDEEVYKDEDSEDDIYEDDEGSERYLYEDKGVGGEDINVNNVSDDRIDGGNISEEKAEDVSSNIKEIEIIY